MPTFVTTPSRARSGAALAGVVAGAVVINALSLGLVAVLVWLAGTVAIALLLLQPGPEGQVINVASIVAGRPVAVSARARERVNLDRITPELRRFHAAALVMLSVVVVGALAAAVALG